MRTTVTLIYIIVMFPIIGMIALFDWGNGKTFKQNLNEIYGLEAQKKKNNVQ